MTFFQTLTAAINDVALNGFDSAARVATWIRKIREAAVASLVPESVVEDQLQKAFRSTYKRLVDDGTIMKYHPGVARFTLDRVKPALRAELDRRLMASRELIRLNRAAAIEKTTQRFSGWATSVPPGGTGMTDKVETKESVRKALASLPFEERRVATDQGHKFVSNLSDILAIDSGAIAATWNSNWRQRNYQYREDHKERDGQVYVVRGNWALEKGLMKTDGHEYTDAIEKPGEFVYCRCTYTYIYNLRALPPDMLTDKGRTELARLRASIDA